MATVNNAEPSIAKDQLRRIKRDLADPFEYTAKAKKPARMPQFVADKTFSTGPYRAKAAMRTELDSPNKPPKV